MRHWEVQDIQEDPGGTRRSRRCIAIQEIQEVQEDPEDPGGPGGPRGSRRSRRIHLCSASHPGFDPLYLQF